MSPFHALFQSKNDDMIDAFYGTVVMISSSEGKHTIWYLDADQELKSADSKLYTITRLEDPE